MTPLADLLDFSHASPTHAPWPRVVVDADTWLDVAALLGEGGWTLLGLWADASRIHMAIADDAAPAAVAVVCLDAEDGGYPSVGRYHPAAIRLERALRDLSGLQPEGLPDPRPWLDHGAWGVSTPLAASRGERAEGTAPAEPAPEGYAFLRVEGENLHEIPVGPVHAGVIEPGHFRFTVDGETVVRLEERLGYTHKGLESLLAGSTLDHAGRLAGRASGDSTVAYAFAFARAAEAACAITPPPRAIWLRALMAELERMANHLGDMGAVCNDASFGIMHAHCGVLREQVLRAAATCFGHRLMMDRIVPGGVAVDIDAAGLDALHALLREIGIAPAATRRDVRPDRLAAGPHRQHRHRASRRWYGVSAAAAMWAAPPAAISTPAATCPTRPTTSCASPWRCRPRAMSTHGSGCASARSTRASG